MSAKQVTQKPTAANTQVPSVDKEYRYRVKRARHLGSGLWDEPEALPIQEAKNIKPSGEEVTEIISSTGPKEMSRFSARQLATDQWVLFRYCSNYSLENPAPDIFLSVYIDTNLFGAQFDEGISRAYGSTIIATQAYAYSSPKPSNWKNIFLTLFQQLNWILTTHFIMRLLNMLTSSQFTFSLTASGLSSLTNLMYILLIRLKSG